MSGSITLIVDGRSLTVPEGTTVLQAARGIGVHLPTLCYSAARPPSSSCFLCAVEVEGRLNLQPSCSLPVAEGMVVTTRSEDLNGARKMALELLLSDHAGDCVAPCAAHCPAGLDIPGFLRPLAAGRVEEAVPIVQEGLVLPGALGRICPRLCEGHCRRSDHDEGISIGSLHRYVADQRDAQPEVLPPATGLTVGIVGAGPSGLTAAHHLRRQGHGCTIYDAKQEAGGMLRWAVPAFRLPRAVLAEEVRLVEDLGAEFRFGQRWGEDFRLEELLSRHDAVYLAVGAPRARALSCPGNELALSGLELLERVAEGETPELGEDVVVVGGGNTAVDVARTAVRLGASRVRIVYRRSRREMPCLLEEVQAAEAEGVEVSCLVSPFEIEAGDGRLRLVLQEMELGEPDESGRRRPVPREGELQETAATSVVAALGQAIERELLEAEGLELTWSGVRVDPQTLQTSRPGVFAGGDAVLGADVAVRAVAMGSEAAVAIDQFLRGEDVVGPDRPIRVEMQPMDELERAAIFREIERKVRIQAPHLPLEQRRAGFDEVETALSSDVAAEEARRCMSCGCSVADGCGLRSIATLYGADPLRFVGERRRFEQDRSHPELLFEPGKCILCGICVEVAAEAGEELGLSLVDRGFGASVGTPFGRPLGEALRHSGPACAEACPTGALTLRSARACDVGCSFAPVE